MLILMKFDEKYAQVIIFPIVCSVILINSQSHRTVNIRQGLFTTNKSEQNNN